MTKFLGMACTAAALLAVPALAQESTNRLTGLKLSGNDPIQIESDKLEVRETEGTAIFTGNVSVVQGPTLLKSGSMTVHYAKGGGSVTTGASSIERIDVNDKVYVKSETQEATGDAATFDMKTEVLVLTGKEVVLSDGPNVVQGCKLTVQMKTGQAKVDGCGGENSSGGTGRVKVLLNPKSQQQTQ